VRRIPEYIATAYRHAMRGRPGPVYLEIPYDVMEAKIGAGDVVIPPKPALLRHGADPAALEQLADLIASANRPVAIAGSGALWAGADAELARFIEKSGIPLLLTTAALAMPFDPDLVFGLGSMGAGRPSLEAIAGADLILLLGTRVNFLLGFGQPPFFSSEQKIAQIDVEAAEIDANRPVDLGIAADLGLALRALNEMALDTPSIDKWRAEIRQNQRDFAAELKPLRQGDETPMHPYQLVSGVEEARSDDSLLVLDGANSILWALMAARIRPAGGIVISTLGELEAIGAGVAQALALKRAHPDRQVVLHTGDGSFGYGLVEMETAVRYGIPFVVVVHNDKGWGMTRDMQVEYFGANRELGNVLGLVRYDEVVKAFGGYGEYVESPAELPGALQRALDSGLPACVNVLVDAEPKSPGLMMFMMMEVMLGKETYYDRIPDWMRKLRPLGLEGVASKAMLRYMDRMLHGEMQ
jgi:acetolactate synthase-1/2/3 large subunit